MYTHANKTKNRGWIYWGGGGGVQGGAGGCRGVQGGAIFYDKAKKTK